MQLAAERACVARFHVDRLAVHKRQARLLRELMEAADRSCSRVNVTLGELEKRCGVTSVGRPLLQLEKKNYVVRLRPGVILINPDCFWHRPIDYRAPEGTSEFDKAVATYAEARAARGYTAADEAERLTPERKPRPKPTPPKRDDITEL